MNVLTLKQLRYFQSLSIHGHFGRAAEVVAISQPALSMQIKELEETVGAALFERRGRQVALTALGEEFAPRVREILRAVDELADLPRAFGDALAGPLRIGVIPTIAPYLLPRVIEAIGSTYPNLELRLRETITPRLVSELAEGKLDAAILALPINAPGLSEEDLFRESFVLVRPKGDAALPVPDRQGLAELKLLLLEEGHCFRDQALSFCELPSTRPRELMDGSSLSTLVQMVGAGIGVTLIPEMAVPVETRSAEVSIARFPKPEPERRIGLVWRTSAPIADQIIEVAGVIRSAAKHRA